jgi:hypothetical protein
MMGAGATGIGVSGVGAGRGAIGVGAGAMGIGVIGIGAIGTGVIGAGRGVGAKPRWAVADVSGASAASARARNAMRVMA